MSNKIDFKIRNDLKHRKLSNNIDANSLESDKQFHKFKYRIQF